MRYISSSLAAAALIAGSSSTAFANTLIIEPTSENLVPVDFQYRFDTTRKWPGCWQYDVLQGSGWYPSAWHHNAAFTPIDGDYEIEFQRTWTERYCAAAMTIYNYVSVEWTNPEDPTQIYRGVIQVDGQGKQKFDEVTCTLTDPTTEWGAIECERAAVNLASSSPATILVNLNGLP